MAEIKNIPVPDIGDFDGVEVIEILVAPGDVINPEDPIVSLESDKAAMEIPSPYAGTVKEIKVNMGDSVSQGDLLITIEASADVSETAPAETETTTPAPASATPTAAQAASPKPSPQPSPRPSPATPINEGSHRNTNMGKAHASPSVRKFARELGADLSLMSGSGAKNRIVKEDVKAWVKQALAQGTQGGGLGEIGRAHV